MNFYKTEENRKTPFKSYQKAINFYKLKNPARQRFANILEPPCGSNVLPKHFSGFHPHDWYSEICHSIFKVMKQSKEFENRAFWDYEILERSSEQIGKTQKVTARTILNYVYRFRKKLTDELIRRNLISDNLIEKRCSNCQYFYVSRDNDFIRLQYCKKCYDIEFKDVDTIYCSDFKGK